MIFLLEYRSTFYLNRPHQLKTCAIFYLKKKKKNICIIQRKIHSDRLEWEKEEQGNESRGEQLHKPRRHQRRKLADFQDIVSWQNACDSRNDSLYFSLSLSCSPDHANLRDSLGKWPIPVTFVSDAKGKLWRAIKALTENRYGFGVNVRDTREVNVIYFSPLYF